MKEIGGYMELERLTGIEYHDGLYRFNLGRTALVWLLEKLNCRKLYAPIYDCDTVANSVTAAGLDVSLYHIDENLDPVLGEDFTLGDDEWLYIINYYGQFDEERIRGYQKRYGRIIVDNAQAYFVHPVGDIPTIYSCRKFLGVCDGAYLSAPLLEFDEDLPQDNSIDRMRYLVGRLEFGARGFYSDMLDECSKFADARPMKMSLFTENVLRGLDYENIRKRRVSNYRTLRELLPSDNPFTKKEPFGPFAYPYYHENGVALRKYLAENNIFVPTNWSYLISSSPEEWLEHRWSADILPLPVDQRYSDEEMKQIAEMVKRF